MEYNIHTRCLQMCMIDYIGYVVTVADVKSFCATMTKAIRVGRLLCAIYNQDTFSITLTSTGDTATFSKDTLTNDPKVLVQSTKRRRHLAKK